MPTKAPRRRDRSDSGERLRKIAEDEKIPCGAEFRKLGDESALNRLGTLFAQESEVIGTILGDEAQDPKSQSPFDAQGRDTDKLAAAPEGDDEGLRSAALFIEAGPSPGIAQERVGPAALIVKSVPIPFEHSERVERARERNVDGGRERGIHDAGFRRQT